MKSIFILIIGLMFGTNAYSQQPVFLSPYKNGRPVPESAKDYSKLVPVNLLNGGANKQSVSPKANKDAERATETENIKPVMQNSAKKDNQTK